MLHEVMTFVWSYDPIIEVETDDHTVECSSILLCGRRIPCIHIVVSLRTQIEEALLVEKTICHGHSLFHFTPAMIPELFRYFETVLAKTKSRVLNR